MVVFVDAELLTVNLAVPPEDPPIYPAAEVPEHPLQETTLAPLLSVALSPSYQFSEGPPLIAPLLGSTMKLT